MPRARPACRLERAGWADQEMSSEIEERPGDEEDVLLAHHRHQRAGRAEGDRAPDGPSLPDADPCPEKQRGRKRRARVRENRRDVHVEEQRRADPHGHGRHRPVADDAAGDGQRAEHGEKPIAGRTDRHGGDVGLAEAVGRGAGREGDDVSRRIERRPEQRAADGREVPPASRRVLFLEKRLMKGGILDLPRVVEILVFVLERDVAIER